jgi:hypothetical protein
VPNPDLNTPLPLQPPAPAPPKPTLAPAWLSLLTAWLGIIMLIASIIFIFLPGTRDPRAELMHRIPYSLADKFLPIPIYGVTVTLFLAIVILYQMRREPRPLPDAMVMQRVQAWVGITLSLLAAAVVYIHVALHGPR